MRRLAGYVDKILKGTPVKELPVETVIQNELIVNLKTAQAIGVAIPPAVLESAVRRIE